MSDASANPLLALVKERGLIDDLQLEEVSQEQTRTGKPYLQLLQDMGMVDLVTLLQIQADHLGTEVVNVGEVDYTPELLKTIPPATARMYQAVPVAVHDTTLQVALSDPLNPSVIDEIAYIVGKEVQIVVADPAQIEKVIGRH